MLRELSARLRRIAFLLFLSRSFFASPAANWLLSCSPVDAAGIVEAADCVGHLFLAKFVALLLLPQYKQQILLPVVLQSAGDLFFARLHSPVASSCRLRSPPTMA